MSHFSVLLIGDDIEAQLAPFHEFECTGINDQYVQDIDQTDEVQADIDEGKTLEEALSDYGLEGCIVDDESKVEKTGQECKHKWGYAIVQDGKLIKAVRRTNQNKKWDWYRIGGCYSGRLLLKEGAVGENGSRSWTNRDEPEDARRVDTARKGDIDFEGMRNEAERETRELYAKRDKLLTAADIDPSTVKWESWSEVYERMAGDNRTDALKAARDSYYSQPAIVALKVKDGFDAPFFDLDRLKRPLDEAIKSARNAAFSTYAVVKDGQWYERGEVGWFGMASNEVSVDEWMEQFNKLVDDLPDDTLLTICDCHI